MGGRAGRGAAQLLGGGGGCGTSLRCNRWWVSKWAGGVRWNAGDIEGRWQGYGRLMGSHEAVGPAFEVADGRVIRVSRGGMLCALNCP